MRVVVDTSVLFAAVIRDARVRRLLLSLGVEWIVPSFARQELERHLPELAAEIRRSGAEAREAAEWILRSVTEVPVTSGDPEFALARRLIGRRDETDVPFVAAALKYSALGVWSLDKDFDGLEGIPRFSTASIERLLELVGPPAEE